MNSLKKICVIGLGYIGLPTSALLASKGYYVHGVDIDPHAVDTINQGNVHIIEPDLDLYVKKAVESGNLKASLTPDFADVFILAVPTPFHHTHDLDSIPKPNLDYVVQATKSIAPYVKDGNIVILESTSPVGTTDLVEQNLKEAGVDVSKLYIAHCPERVLPGRIMTELVENDRIVGGTTEQATKVTADFYRGFVCGEVLETDAKTAEMAKLTENSFRDVNIAFANELSLICDKLGMNVWELIRLANRHPRVNILQPGCGVGGHCIAVDPWFIVDSAPEQAILIRNARMVNDGKPVWVVNKLIQAADHVKTKRIVCLGLAFKPDIDDLRESPAIEIVNMLASRGFDVSVVEPNIKQLPPSLENQCALIKLSDVDQDDVVGLLVAHKEFKQNDALLHNAQLIDFTGVLNLGS